MKSRKLHGEYCPYCGKTLLPFMGSCDGGKEIQILQCRHCQGNPIFETGDEGFIELDRQEFIRALRSS